MSSSSNIGEAAYTLSTGDLFVFHVVLFLFNSIASIAQGVCGFGDAIVLHVFFQTAFAANERLFGGTSLGKEPFKMVTMLMYCRIIFSAPLLAYWSLKDGLFSWSMTIAMAVPSTLTAILGLFIFAGSEDKTLKMVLGITSIIFGIMYVFILGYRYFQKQMKVRALAAKTARGEIESHTAFPDAEQCTDPANNSSVDENGPTGGGGSRSNKSSENEYVKKLRDSFSAPPPGMNKDPLSGATKQGNRKKKCEDGEEPSDAEDSIKNSSFGEVLHSVRGSPFTLEEAYSRVITEDNAPPLSPGKLSPLRTMSYTRVRVNRNLDENGKIKLSTKIGAGVFAGLSGIMGSLTGVGGPAQIVFILLFDVPNYIIRVNFTVQSIPSSAIRFIFAVSKPLLHVDMLPYIINSLIGGYLGIYIGFRLGKVLGPRSYNVFVLFLLWLSALIMITTNVIVLVIFTILTLVVTVVVGYWELQKTKKEVEERVEAEVQIEQQMPQLLSHIQNNNNKTEEGSFCKDEKHFQDRQEDEKDIRKDSSISNVSPATPESKSGRVRKADLRRPPSLFDSLNSAPGGLKSDITPSKENELKMKEETRADNSDDLLPL